MGRVTAQQKESSYSFSGDVKEVKCWRWCWWWGENHCDVTDLSNSSTEYWRTFCLSSVFIVLPSYQSVRWGGVQEIDGQRDTYRWSWLDFLILARPTYNEQGWQLFCDWGRQIKPFFVFTGDTDSCLFFFSLIFNYSLLCPYGHRMLTFSTTADK